MLAQAKKFYSLAKGEQMTPADPAVLRRHTRIKVGLMRAKAEALYELSFFERALIFYHRCRQARPDQSGQFEGGLKKAKLAIGGWDQFARLGLQIVLDVLPPIYFQPTLSTRVASKTARTFSRWGFLFSQVLYLYGIL